MCTETVYNRIEYLEPVMLQLHPPQHHRAASLHPGQCQAPPPPSPAGGTQGVENIILFLYEAPSWHSPITKVREKKCATHVAVHIIKVIFTVILILYFVDIQYFTVLPFTVLHISM